jgi:hypothetical protein
MTSFYAIMAIIHLASTIPTETNILSASSVAYGHWIKAVVENWKKEWEKFSEQMKKYATNLTLNLFPFSQAI